MVLEKTLEIPLDCKEIQPVHSKGDQSWDFFGKNDAKAESPVLWPPHVKSGLIGKDPDAGRDWGQEEKGTTEDEMAGWHHQLNGREFELTLGVVDIQGSLMCCDSWGRKESDTTEFSNVIFKSRNSPCENQIQFIYEWFSPDRPESYTTQLLEIFIRSLLKLRLVTLILAVCFKAKVCP